MSNKKYSYPLPKVPKKLTSGAIIAYVAANRFIPQKMRKAIIVALIEGGK